MTLLFTIKLTVMSFFWTLNIVVMLRISQSSVVHDDVHEISIG